MEVEGGAEKAESEEKSAEPEADTEDEAPDEVDDFEPLADGTKVAVAYGAIFAAKRRRWFAGEVVTYSVRTKKYTVKWKFLPSKGARKLYSCDSARCQAISHEEYDGATEAGRAFIGFHRQSTFVGPESEGDLRVGDHVAAAYGGAKVVKGVEGKFLWYAATVIEVTDDKYTVQWKFPSNKDRATLEADKDKVQPITKNEYNKSLLRSDQKGKKIYGFVGYARQESAINLSTITREEAAKADA